jgi:hypothetical protein
MTKINLQHRIVKQAFTPDIIRETNAWAGFTKPPDNQPVFAKKRAIGIQKPIKNWEF